MNAKYRMLHGCMGLFCSVAFGYNAFYLGEFGFDAGETGMIMALFNVLTALCLPVFGRIADRSKRFHWKNLLLIFISISLVIWGSLLFCEQKLLVGILFQTGGLLISCMYPMVNVACFYYEKRGIPVNFGIARGMNSLVYAIGAFLLGQLTVRIGASVVVVLGVIVCLAEFWPVIRMPYLKQEVPEGTAGRKTTAGKGKKGSIPFWKKYPAFLVMVAGSMLIMTVFSLTTSFLIQIIENVNGDSSNLGIALAICAVMEVPVMMLFSQIVKRISETKLLIISGIMYLVKCVVLFCAGSVSLIYAAQLLQPLSYGLYASASVFFSDKCMEEEDAATGQSLLSMSGCFGSVIGSLAGGWLIELSGVKVMLLVGMAVSFLATVVISVSVKMYRRECRMKSGSEVKVH